MAKKGIDFTAADRNKYKGIIGGIDAENTENVKNTKNTENVKNTKNIKNIKSTENIENIEDIEDDKPARTYNRLDPRKKPPKEYRFTARMPGEYGRFINELAYQRRSSVTAEICRLIEAEMKAHPEILANLDELN